MRHGGVEGQRHRSTELPVVAAVVAATTHLVVGFLYLSSGLVAPLWAVVLLFVIWAVLAWVGVRLVRRRSSLVLLVPVVAAVVWFGVMTLCDVVLGWTA
jgi:predicted PurR-regulated permease PerM